MKNNKFTLKAAIIAAVLSSVMVGSVAVFAAGDEKDPLITLSYLEEIFLPDLTKDLEIDEDALEDITDDLVDEFDDMLKDHEETIEDLIDDIESSIPEENPVYSVETISAGETITAGMGCEILLRSGNAVINSAGAIIDMTDGSELSSGSSLALNHLYLIPVEGSIISSVDTELTVLIRGSYDIA